MVIELLKAREERAIEDIRFLQKSLAATAKVRERFPGDWEVEEDCRHIVFLIGQNIDSLIGEVKDVREEQEKSCGI